MNTMTRAEIMERFKRETEAGKILVGVGAGTGITAKSSEAGGADMLIIYNSGRFRMAGRGSLSGLLSYGDANQIVVEMGAEVLPVVKDTPVLAGAVSYTHLDVYKRQLQTLLLADLLASAAVVPTITGLYSKRISGTAAALATIAGIAVGLPFYVMGESFTSFSLALAVSTVITIIGHIACKKEFDFELLKTNIKEL